jgi:branched-chain amino acid aminotransferase
MKSHIPFDGNLVVYLNGEFLPLRETAISPLDRGFLYGDGVYETMIAANARVFRVDDHIDRLFMSAHALRLPMSVSKDRMRDLIEETLERNRLHDAYIRIVVTRGVGFPVLDPRTPTAGATTVIMTHTREQPRELAGTYRHDGLNLHIVWMRKTPPESLPPQVKSLNYLNQILARMEATDTGADEAVMLDTDGYVAEGSGDNIFAIRSTELVTPGIQTILPGITRMAILELAPSVGLVPVERRMTPHDLITADEVFLTSTYGGVIPVGTVDARDIGTVVPGEKTTELRNRYEDLLYDTETV